MTQTHFEISQTDAPVDETLANEMICLWEWVFQSSYNDYRPVLAGEEVSENRNVLYYAHAGPQLLGTCQLTYPQRGAVVGGLGEVAVVEEFQRQGIATLLTRQARDTFQSQGGQVLFLGTVNPSAARVYKRLGWRRLAGTNVMACLTGENTPEEFLVDYFREQRPCTIHPASAAIRIPIIPLAVVPHDWQILDANTEMFSTRSVVQNSCMGLYPRYESLAQKGNGASFAAWTDDGRMVGLSTVQIDASGAAHVDGFTSHRFADTWDGLIRRTIAWSTHSGASHCEARISVEDEAKQARFESLGFKKRESGKNFSLNGKAVGSFRYVHG